MVKKSSKVSVEISTEADTYDTHTTESIDAEASARMADTAWLGCAMVSFRIIRLIPLSMTALDPASVTLQNQGEEPGVIPP
jgi:hypothetical protein